MKMILREDVKDLGRAGDTVTVAEGYGRNFLLPKKLALVATASNLKRSAQELNGKKGKERRARRDLEYQAEQLSAQPVVITATAGEGGKLFGSVTAADIEQALAARGIQVDKRKIELEEPIKTVGTYTLTVKVAPEISAQLTVLVQTKEAKTETPPAEAPEAPAPSAQV